MAPTLYRKFAQLLLHGKEMQEVKIPYITISTAVELSIASTILYVLPFYLSRLTRPSPTLSRDAPSVIRARVRFVTLSVTLSTLLTVYILSTYAHQSYPAILHSLGIYPVNTNGIARSLALTALLFAGPLFERGIAHGGWRTWIRGRAMYEVLSSWIGWRNYIVGPVTEEVLFRSVIVTLHLLARPTLAPRTLILATPLYFGIAHIHHFYDFTLTHPNTPLLPALVRSLVQFAYTTLFGWYATFLFLRSGSLWVVVLVHAMCNWLGLPRVWGRVGTGDEYGEEEDPKRSQDKQGRVRSRPKLFWSVAYYVLLVSGAVAWWNCLVPLTDGDDEALVDLFAPAKVK